MEISGRRAVTAVAATLLLSGVGAMLLVDPASASTQASQPGLLDPAFGNQCVNEAAGA